MWASDLAAAFTLLTRFPVARFAPAARPPDLARAVWAFPIVGLATGALGGLVYWAAYRLGVPSWLAACWSLAATMLATGALHEDGLADTVDGFGGGGNPARALEIMRDSRIGVFGALALVLSTAMRISAIAAIYDPRLVVPALIAVGALGRGGIIVLLLVLRPARNDGMAASMDLVPTWSAMLGLSLAGAASLLALPVRPAVMASLLGFGACLVLAKLAHARIGGFTGDVLGAAEVAYECVVLTTVAAAIGLR